MPGIRSSSGFHRIAALTIPTLQHSIVLQFLILVRIFLLLYIAQLTFSDHAVHMHTQIFAHSARGDARTDMNESSTSQLNSVHVYVYE